MFWKMVLGISTAWLVLPAVVWIVVNQLIQFLRSPFSQN
jgi:Na+/H+ antiporter NhaB